MELMIEVTHNALQKLIDGQPITVGIISFGTPMRIIVQKRLMGNPKNSSELEAAAPGSSSQCRSGAGCPKAFPLTERDPSKPQAIF